MSNALLVSLLMTIVFGSVGFFLKMWIWDSSKAPSQALDWGRKFSSYLVFISSLTGGNLFLKNDFNTGAIKFLIVVIVFPLIAFIFGYLYGFIRSRSVPNPDISSKSSEVLEKKDSSFILMNRKLILFLMGALILSVIGPLLTRLNSSTTNSKEDRWMPISSKKYESFQEPDGNPKYNWINDSSIHRINGKVTAYIGQDVSSRTPEGALFYKFKIEADCSIPKFRKVTLERFPKGVNDNFGELISEVTDYQKFIATNLLKAAPNYVHNGGWISLSEAKEDILTYAPEKKYASETMVESAQTNIAILKWLCE